MTPLCFIAQHFSQSANRESQVDSRSFTNTQASYLCQKRAISQDLDEQWDLTQTNVKLLNTHLSTYTFWVRFLRTPSAVDLILS